MKVLIETVSDFIINLIPFDCYKGIVLKQNKMNYFFKILVISFLFTNAIGAQEITTTQNPNSTLQLEKPLVNQTKSWLYFCHLI